MEAGEFNDGLIVAVGILCFLIVVIVVVIIIIICCRDRIPFLARNKISMEEKSHASRFGDAKIQRATYSVNGLRAKRGLPPSDPTVHMRRYDEMVEREYNHRKLRPMPERVEERDWEVEERREKRRKKKKSKKSSRAIASSTPRPLKPLKPAPERHDPPVVSNESSFVEGGYYVNEPKYSKEVNTSPNYMDDDESDVEVSVNGAVGRYEHTNA